MDEDSDPVKIHNLEVKVESSSLSQSTNAPTHESNESDQQLTVHYVLVVSTV